MLLLMDWLVASNQTTFIKGRYILESVVTTHEVIDSLSRSDSKGIVLKLDYEKAFDRINLDFLEELLIKNGFGSTGLAGPNKLLMGNMLESN